MYKGKRVMDEAPRKKPALLMASLVMLLTVSVVGTVALLVTSAGPVENTFTPAKVPNEVVEKIDGAVKNDVRIHNLGNVDAYVRAAVVVNWVNDEGHIYGGAVPEAGEDKDYQITWSGLSDGTWKKGADGYYYYTQVVKADDGKADGDDETGVLFTDCKPIVGRVPDGYKLSVEIMGQTIQADGQNSEGKPPVELAWGEKAARLVGASAKEG